ncbi:branched chain amino acid aminotransferase, partial [candidate division GN15 bacterium]|nr:branched chain amino acid aminotransferase [candidate division GN15 bacterium]
FLVRNGALITPTFSASILPGITRRSIIKLAEDMGIKVIEQNVPRESLYLADEVFFTGSAAEVTPISKIDNIPIGEGKAGPITLKLQKAFFDIIEGAAEDKYGWLTHVPKYEGVTA